MQLFLQSVWAFLTEMAACALIAIFLENTIFTRALGTSSILLMLRKKFNILLFGLIMTVITLISSIIVALLKPYMDRVPQYSYLLPVTYVLVIGVVYIFTLIFCAKFLRKKMQQVRPLIHMSAFNCAVLGALLLSTNGSIVKVSSAAGIIGFGLGSGIGFTLAAYLIAISYDKLNSEQIPKAFRGFPITMIYIGILSLAFYGLVGHQLPH